MLLSNTNGMKECTVNTGCHVLSFDLYPCQHSEVKTLSAKRSVRSMVEVKHRILHQERLMKRSAALLRIKHCDNVIRLGPICWIV